MKKHKFPPELIGWIKCQQDYYQTIFKSLATTRNNPLFVPQVKNNGDLIMLCPFHKERTPSFRVNRKNNCFKCFGCGKGGDLFIFIQKHFKISFFESIELLLEIQKPRSNEKFGLYDPNHAGQLHIEFPPHPLTEKEMMDRENPDLPF